MGHSVEPISPAGEAPRLFGFSIGGVMMEIRGEPELDSLLQRFRSQMAGFCGTGTVDLALNIFPPASVSERVSGPSAGQTMADACIGLILQRATTVQRRLWAKNKLEELKALLTRPTVMPLLDLFLQQSTLPGCVILEAGFLMLDLRRNISILLLNTPPAVCGPGAEDAWLIRVNITIVNAVMCLLSHHLAATDGVVAHAVGLNYRGGGYAFAAPSGGGKTSLSMQSPPGSILADDGVIIRRQGDGYVMYPTPFRQRPGGDKCRWAWNQAEVPLHRLFLLEKSGETCLADVSRAEAVDRLLRATTHFLSFMAPDVAVSVFDFWRELVRRCPVARLNWRKGDDFFQILK